MAPATFSLQLHNFLYVYGELERSLNVECNVNEIRAARSNRIFNGGKRYDQGNASDFHFFIEQDLEWRVRLKRDDEVKATASPFMESRSAESFANGMKKLAIIWKNRYVSSQPINCCLISSGQLSSFSRYSDEY